MLALRDNAFEAELAGMGEDGRAVAFHMLIEPDAGAGAETGPKLQLTYRAACRISRALPVFAG